MNSLLGRITFMTALIIAGNAGAFISQQTQNAAKNLGAETLGEVKFTEGTNGITDAYKEQIKRVVTEAREKGTVDHVNVLAWSDQEYPVAGSKQSRDDIRLAKERLESVESYLKTELNITNVDAFNMAKRPTEFQDLFKTADANIKDTAENSGAAPQKTDQTGLLGQKGQASKAVVMIFLKK